MHGKNNIRYQRLPSRYTIHYSTMQASVIVWSSPLPSQRYQNIPECLSALYLGQENY